MDTNKSITKDKLWSNRIWDFQESGLTRKEWCYQNQLPSSFVKALIYKKKVIVLWKVPKRNYETL